jgi:hypothetical protein
MVLICLIFSVLSTIDQYETFANETLFYMVSLNLYQAWTATFSCFGVRYMVSEICIKHERLPSKSSTI